MAQHSSAADPCSDFTFVQRNALIWFFCAIALGLIVTVKFSAMDRWMYDNNAEFIDTKALKENRVASGSIRSETLDPRQGGDLVNALSKMQPAATK